MPNDVKQLDYDDIVAHVTAPMIKTMFERYMTLCESASRMSIAYPAGLQAYHQRQQTIEGMMMMLAMLGVPSDILDSVREMEY